MTAEIFITEEHKQVVAEMAANGMTVEMIAKHIGMSRATLWRKPELVDIYRINYTKSINKVANALISRALNGETQLLQFVMRTRGGWKEHCPQLSDNYASKTHQEKQAELDDLLKNAEITIDGYTKLSHSINEQYQVSEHEKRINELEKVVATHKNNGANAAARNAVLANEQNGDNQNGETNNSETQEDSGEPIRTAE
jgi:hypothetical protein